MPDSKVTTIETKGTFAEGISKASPDIQEIAHAARDLLIEVMSDITDCYIAPFKKHVNLGFMYGADLPDPEGLLEGVGKPMRHIKIRSLDDLKQPAVKKLVEVASKHLPKLVKV